MKKIIIVGHPLSGYQEVEALLNDCGMQQAQPSRREGFSPQEVSAIMAQAHDAFDLKHLGKLEQIQQLEPSPVWNGMALDLMLGNLDQNVWGWSDPKAIFLMDYWRSIDPQITFMLVYDRPHSVLTHLDAEEATAMTEADIAEQTRSWHVYNAALLHFFHRNTERCLLVSSQQVRESVGGYLKQVRARIDAPWSEKMDALLAIETTTSVVNDQPESNANTELSPVSQSVTAVFQAPAVQVHQATQQSDNPLALYVVDALIRQQPESVQLYEELQTVADLPLAEREVAELAPLDAFRALAAQQNAYKHVDELAKQRQMLLQKIQEAKETSERLAQQELAITREKLRIQNVRTAEEQRTLNTLEEQKQYLQQEQQETQQENGLLLEQLHKVQEELEKHYLDAQTHKQSLQALEKKSEEQLTALRRDFDSVNKSDAEVTELQEENDLLLEQLHKVQEELERFYLENRALKQKMQAKAEPVYYGAAERVKAQLSYKLGARMITCSRSLGGWIGMPFALSKEVKLFRQSKEKRAAEKLPPIHKYCDAHEAEVIRQHLSYRLGQAMINNSNSFTGWIKMPWIMRREIKEFHQRRAARTK